MLRFFAVAMSARPHRRGLVAKQPKPARREDDHGHQTDGILTIVPGFCFAGAAGLASGAFSTAKPSIERISSFRRALLRLLIGRPSLWQVIESPRSIEYHCFHEAIPARVIRRNPRTPEQVRLQIQAPALRESRAACAIFVLCEIEPILSRGSVIRRRLPGRGCMPSCAVLPAG
jgi:hypothetical protein